MRGGEWEQTFSLYTFVYIFLIFEPYECIAQTLKLIKNNFSRHVKSICILQLHFYHGEMQFECWQFFPF